VQRRTLIRSVAAGALALPLGAAAACEDSGDSAGKSLEKVTYLTSYGTFGRESFAYVALEKGYFRDAGFDVEIKPGNGTGDDIRQILAGKALFSPIDLTGGLLAIGGKSRATGFVAVAAIHQRTLASVISLEGMGITTPRDLEGKTLGDPTGAVNSAIFPTYAKLAGVDASKVRWVDKPAQQVMGILAKGQVDGIGQFVVGKPTLEAIAKPRKAVVLPYSDYLQDLYGNVLITSTAYAEKKPDSVKRFTLALLKGLADTINDPAEASNILKKHVAATNLAAAVAEISLMTPYVRSAASGIPVGAVDAGRVARSIAILQGAGQIDPGLKPEQVVNFDVVPMG